MRSMAEGYRRAGASKDADGRIIRDLEDAKAFAREQEARPGVDQRDEILHKMERAEGDEEAHAAAHRFLRWLEELDILE